MKRFILVSLIIAMLALSACSVVIIEGSGNVITEPREVSAFNAIELSAFGKLIITQGSTESLTIETDDNLMQYILTEVDSSTLIIKLSDDSFNFSDGETQVIRPSDNITYHVTVADLTAITFTGAGTIEMADYASDNFTLEVNGAGSVNFDNFTADTLNIIFDGAGTIDISGAVTQQTIEITGFGHYDAEELSSVNAAITLDGAGGAVLWVTDTLDVSITGAGDVDYYGDPTLMQDVTGTGVITSKGTK